MPDRNPTIWLRPPHTGAKHSIFRRHLEAWFPKLSWTGLVRVIDGFAGPGEYSRGEPGSPLIAVQVAQYHKANLSKCRIEFEFIEERTDRFLHLEAKIAELDVPYNITIRTRKASFKNALKADLDEVNRTGTHFPPSFVMIDPLGFEGVPMASIERLARQPRSEVLISFMYDSVTRWLSDSRNSSNFNELFDSTSWQHALAMSSADDRRDFLLGLYVEQLRSHGWRYTRTFEMRDEDNRTEYFLVFATNHIDGLKVMKQAMWKVDPSGGFVFSDATDKRQLTLFDPTPNYSQLKALILQRFGQEPEVPIEVLEEYVLVETAFRETHFRRQILDPMEKSATLETLRSTRKGRVGYPPGTVIRFRV